MHNLALCIWFESSTTTNDDIFPISLSGEAQWISSYFWYTSFHSVHLFWTCFVSWSNPQWKVVRCTANRKCSCLSIVRSCHRNSSSHSTFVHKLHSSDYLHQLLWIWRGNVYNKRDCSFDELCKSFKKIISLWTRCNVLGSNGCLWTTFSRYRNCLRNQNRTFVLSIYSNIKTMIELWLLVSEVVFFDSEIKTILVSRVIWL